MLCAYFRVFTQHFQYDGNAMHLIFGGLRSKPISNQRYISCFGYALCLKRAQTFQYIRRLDLRHRFAGKEGQDEVVKSVAYMANGDGGFPFAPRLKPFFSDPAKGVDGCRLFGCFLFFSRFVWVNAIGQELSRFVAPLAGLL